MAIEPDYYQVLGVAPDASRDEIKATYRRAVRSHHPDAAPAELKGAAHAKIQLIIAAWTVLGDVPARAAYDEKRRRASVEEARLRSEANAATEPKGHAPAREIAPSPRGSGEDVRKKSRVQAVMGAGQAPRSANPRTKLLAMVFDAAQLYHVEGRPDEAARVCQSVLRADPTNAEAAVLLADIYISQSKRSAALDLLERALRLQPSNALYRSKWEALRHSSTPTTPTPSSPAASNARSTGPNPWSRVPEGSPLASRISVRPDASTDKSLATSSPRDETSLTTNPETIEPIASEAAASMQAHHQEEQPEPLAPPIAPPTPVNNLLSVEQKPVDVDSPKKSLLQRLRSRLSG